MEWLVKNAVNKDVERQHLNKILQDIKAVIDNIKTQISSTKQQDVKALVGQMVEGNSERGVAVSFNPQKKTLDFVANDFVITLTGDVEGSATVSGLNSVTINTALDTSLNPVAPSDGNYYWQHNGGWEIVVPNISDLQYIEDVGIMVRSDNEEGNTWVGREIEGTTDQIDVANGDGVLGNPILSLADLADAGGGTFKLIVRDAKGRVLGTSDGTTDNVPEGTNNLYFTDERAIVATSCADSLPNSDTSEIIPGQAVARYGTGYVRASCADAAKAKVSGIARGNTAIPVGDNFAPQAEGMLSLTVPQWEAALGTPGGLATTMYYYLGVDGQLTTVPTTTDGEFIVPVGLAVSPTTLHIRVNSTIQL